MVNYLVTVLYFFLSTFRGQLKMAARATSALFLLKILYFRVGNEKKVGKLLPTD